MRIDAKHVRRKELNVYLPAGVLQRHKRQVLPLSASTGSLINGALGAAKANAGDGATFAQPRKRPSDVALDGVLKKIRTREAPDGSRQLEVSLLLLL